MIADDFKYFKENRASIIKEHLNEFVVIKNAKILGYYKTEQDALQEMVKRNEDFGSFITQKCITEEEGKVMFYTRRVAL